MLKKQEDLQKTPLKATASKAKTVDPAIRRKQEITAQNRAIIKTAFDIAKKNKAKALFIYVDAIDENVIPDKLPEGVQIILITKSPEYTYNGKHPFKDIVVIPRLKLGRMALIKIAVVFALSAKMVHPDDKIVSLVGKSESNSLDTLMYFQISTEQELLTGHSLADMPKSIIPAVFEHTLNLAIEFGNKGKEGKPIGTIFVLGDEEKAMQLSKQMIINPFKGYEPEERNILNPALKETLRELSSVDGAFIIAGNGEIITAGRYLGASMEDSDIPRGLGSRHLAASGITALTKAIAIVISESTGDVRIFREGKIIMEIEKASHV
ncbi:MAG: DNA integrity scanning protein DisA nucleotide-binding domain protein [Deltaproteobacteria bacterium]|nr:DNA integrity scanning protein DisA nucleotide-binding domain protein [Deltaproteobacteria bacterium]